MSEFRSTEDRAAAALPTDHVGRRASGARVRSGRFARLADTLPLELAAARGLVDPALLEIAAWRANALGIGGDEVLRCHGILSADLLTEALADRLGLEIDPLDDDRSPRSPRLIEAVRTGVLARTAPDGRKLLTVAPRGLGIRRLAQALKGDPALAQHLRLAAPERLADHVRRVGAGEFARETVLGLCERAPHFSAVTRGRHGLRWITFLLCLALVAGAVTDPDRLLFAVEGILGLTFLAWIALRLRSCGIRPAPSPAFRLADRELSIYSIIVPLYREAHMVRRLVAALTRLDYPREKLDIKLVIEPDDAETRSAVAQLALRPPFEVIVSPLAGPRTKPKALAAALPFVRGDFVVVYDAEDEPEPNQLHAAIAAFQHGPPELVCVQARLAVDNVSDSWLTRQFAAEYAGLFDVFLPALADLKLPLLLGGTSNHFRTEVLRRIGGWDPFNVTEDADLGMRLSRLGYRTGVTDSTTFEEAPVRLRPWIRQRTRWFKGWMQTWLVHMRAPRRLKRELGWRGFLALQLLVGGTVLAALVHPFFLALVVHDAASGAYFEINDSSEALFRRGLAMTTLIAGYGGTAILGMVGLSRRRMLGSAWVLFTIPIYWLLLSLAAWRAMWQLLIAPHRWEKTEHGLARSSHSRLRHGEFRRKPPSVGRVRPGSVFRDPKAGPNVPAGPRPRPVPRPDR